MSNKDRRNSISFSTSSNNLEHKNAKYKSRKTQFSLTQDDDESRDPNQTLFDTLMNDPTKRKLIMQLLASKKNEIEEYKRQEEKKKDLCSSPIKKMKRKQILESPTALLRRRAIEKRDKLNSSPVSSTSSECSKLSGPSPIPVPYECLLEGVKAFVDVRSKNIDRSAAVIALLKSMGAEVKETFTSDVTHVIFKDGTFPTYHKAKLLKKFLVSILWLEATRTSKVRQPEKNFPALGVSGFEQEASILCDKFQKEYKSLVKDELRRSIAVIPETPSPRKKIDGLINSINQVKNESINKKSFQSEDDIIPSSQREDLALTITGINKRLASPTSVADESDMESDCGIIDGKTYRDKKCIILTESNVNKDTYKKKLKSILQENQEIDKQLSNNKIDNDKSKNSADVDEFINNNDLRIPNEIEIKTVTPKQSDNIENHNITNDSLSEQLARFVTVRKKKSDQEKDNKQSDLTRKKLTYMDSPEDSGISSTKAGRDKLLDSLFTINKMEASESLSSFSLHISGDKDSLNNQPEILEDRKKKQSNIKESLSNSKSISEMSSILITHLPTSTFISLIKDDSKNKEVDQKEAGSSIAESSLEPNKKSSLNSKEDSVDTVKDTETSIKDLSPYKIPDSKLQNTSETSKNTDIILKSQENHNPLKSSDSSIEIVEDSETPTTKKSSKPKQICDRESFDPDSEAQGPKQNKESIEIVIDSESSLRKSSLEAKIQSPTNEKYDSNKPGSQSTNQTTSKLRGGKRSFESINTDEASPPKRRNLGSNEKQITSRQTMKDFPTSSIFLKRKGRKTESALNNLISTKPQYLNSDLSSNEISLSDTEEKKSNRIKKRKLYNPSQLFNKDLKKKETRSSIKKVSPCEMRKSRLQKSDAASNETETSLEAQENHNPPKKSDHTLEIIEDSESPTATKPLKKDVHESIENVKESEAAKEKQVDGSIETKGRDKAPPLKQRNVKNNKQNTSRQTSKDFPTSSSFLKNKSRKTESVLNKINENNFTSTKSLNSDISSSEISSGDTDEKKSGRIRKRKLYNPNQSFDEELKKKIEEENKREISIRREIKKPGKTFPKFVLTENAKLLMQQRLKALTSSEENSSCSEDEENLGSLVREIASKKIVKKSVAQKKVIFNGDCDEQKLLLKEFEKVLGKDVDTPEVLEKKTRRNKVLTDKMQNVTPFKTPQGVPKRTLKRVQSNASEDSLPIKAEVNRRSSLEFMPRKLGTPKKSGKHFVHKPTIVCTRFHRDEVKSFRDIVDQLGRFEIESNVSDRTTHLVVGESIRTINILRGISRGLWIVNKEWLFLSQKKGAWLPEEDFEMVDFSPAVQKARIQRESFGPKFPLDVFAKCGEIHIVKSAHPKCSELEELVRLCKGILVSTARKAAIVVGEYLRYENKSYVKETWILDSITENKALKLCSYELSAKESSQRKKNYKC